MTTREVYLTGRDQPITVDGVAAGLRVYDGEDYLQFFVPYVPGRELWRDSDAGSDEWWAALVAVGVERLRQVVDGEGFVPLEPAGDGWLIAISAADVRASMSAIPPPPPVGEGSFYASERVASF